MHWFQLAAKQGGGDLITVSHERLVRTPFLCKLLFADSRPQRPDESERQSPATAKELGRLEDQAEAHKEGRAEEG